MSIVLILFSVVSHLVGAFLLFNVLYLLFFAIAGYRQTPSLAVDIVDDSVPRRICVLMPAYRADAVILQTALLAQRHVYAGLAQVLVIADGLQPATIASLRQQNIEVLEVFFEKSTKGKALRAALAMQPAGAYDVALVLDVDNIMAPDFLWAVDQSFRGGYQVVQGHRTAKNLDSPFAVLDACNEEINNHIYRQGHASLGMSAALIGSGMAFEHSLLKQLLEDIGDTSGEDKEMDFRILKAGLKIGYLPHAYIYDEKIPNAQAFTTQRTRWIAAQLEFLQKYFWEGPRQLLRGNLEFFDKVLQTLLVPRVLLLGLLGVLVFLALLGLPGPGPWYWAALLVGTVAALLLSLPARLYNWQVARALWHLPLALVSMVSALVQVRKAKTSFLHTIHTEAPMAEVSSNQPLT